MCSIFGCLNYNNYLSSKEFIKSNNSMINRGPDYSEVKEYIIEDKILRFGFNRLSILDLSDNGNQPMLSSCQRYALIFNGEIYNHLELRKDEKLLNNTWKGTSDSETLINLFQHYDLEKILNKLEGMFAFAVFDIKEKKLFLARDRSG
ncbi:MAG: Asparagine synthetase [glutamine-hydrolyzing] 1, partial [Alphaproteobacteria bacterium MarineAlpha5_Bin6]